jgi:hypothetical protein
MVQEVQLEVGRLSAYSVEELIFGADAIFQFYGRAAENPTETRPTAD